jgi:hypothetical protein
MDRGYIDFERLFILTRCSPFFVVRAKESYSRPVAKPPACDPTTPSSLPRSIQPRAYPDPLRRVTYYDARDSIRLSTGQP